MIVHQHIDQSKAENYSGIHHHISLAAVMTNGSDVNAVSRRDPCEQRLHINLKALVTLWSVSKAVVSPAYRHIFDCDRVEAEVTSIRGRCKVQRTMIRFDPLTIRADGMIAGSSTAGEGRNDDDQQERARHSSLTPDALRSSFSARR